MGALSGFNGSTADTLVDPLEGLEMPVYEPPQVGGRRVARRIQRQRAETGGGPDAGGDPTSGGWNARMVTTS